MEGFRRFDWDGDAQWQAFNRNLEVPNPRLLEKAKAKWYSREIDPAFDAASIGSGAASASRPAAAAAPAPEPSVTEPRGGAANEPRPSAAPRPQAFTGGGFGARLQAALRQGGGLERVLFVQHLLLIALFILYLQPLNRTLSRASYGQFQLVAVISYFMKVGLRIGAPRLKPFPAALKSWFVQAAATTDLQYAIICGAFAGARPMLLVCIPTVVLAVYHAFAYASSHFGNAALWQRYGQPAHARLADKQRDAQLYNAGAEVGLGFLTLLNLLTRDRNIMLAILYWQILRTRYHTPDCAAYHRQVWGILAQTTRPLLDSVPVLRTPIGLAHRWFTNVR